MANTIITSQNWETPVNQNEWLQNLSPIELQKNTIKDRISWFTKRAWYVFAWLTFASSVQAATLDNQNPVDLKRNVSTAWQVIDSKSMQPELANKIVISDNTEKDMIDMLTAKKVLWKISIRQYEELWVAWKQFILDFYTHFKDNPQVLWLTINCISLITEVNKAVYFASIFDANKTYTDFPCGIWEKLTLMEEKFPWVMDYFKNVPEAKYYNLKNILALDTVMNKILDVYGEKAQQELAWVQQELVLSKKRYENQREITKWLKELWKLFDSLLGKS